MQKAGRWPEKTQSNIPSKTGHKRSQSKNHWCQEPIQREEKKTKQKKKKSAQKLCCYLPQVSLHNQQEPIIKTELTGGSQTN